MIARPKASSCPGLWPVVLIASLLLRQCYCQILDANNTGNGTDPDVVQKQCSAVSTQCLTARGQAIQLLVSR